MALTLENQERFFDLSRSYSNPLIVSAVLHEPPSPHHFCRRTRNFLLDPPDDLTIEIEKHRPVPKALIGLKRSRADGIYMLN
ncbi:hypothetical protein EVAR_26785_1 [Eumeta japonica]|uniref:Uncharacterized protein n=1 Tax=Eumeta variegata TaxID=151549 RepID=A0A4C1XAQ8_EUMVA|nr:hypothetical protein EVAR_26785_1 [Eumeta japonica]